MHNTLTAIPYKWETMLPVIFLLKGSRKRKGFKVRQVPPPPSHQPLRQNETHVSAVVGTVVSVIRAGYAFVEPTNRPRPNISTDAQYCDGSAVSEGDHVTFDIIYDAKGKRKGVDVRRIPQGGK